MNDMSSMDHEMQKNTQKKRPSRHWMVYLEEVKMGPYHWQKFRVRMKSDVEIKQPRLDADMKALKRKLEKVKEKFNTTISLKENVVVVRLPKSSFVHYRDVFREVYGILNGFCGLKCLIEDRREGSILDSLRIEIPAVRNVGAEVSKPKLARPVLVLPEF